MVLGAHHPMADHYLGLLFEVKIAAAELLSNPEVNDACMTAYRRLARMLASNVEAGKNRKDIAEPICVTT
jgi:hypothetical protein